MPQRLASFIKDNWQALLNICVVIGVALIAYGVAKGSGQATARVDAVTAKLRAEINSANSDQDHEITSIQARLKILERTMADHLAHEVEQDKVIIERLTRIETRLDDIASRLDKMEK